MKKIMWVIPLLIIFAGHLEAKVIAIHDDIFTVDDQPFYILGVGYEPGCRYGQIPWQRTFDEKLIRFDFAMIKKMGANTIRGWSPYSDDELRLANEYELFVIQGVWIDFNKYFSADESGQREILDYVKGVIAKNKKWDHILLYLVMNEPRGELLIDIGEDEMYNRFQNLREACREADPNARVSFSNCALNDYIDYKMWDAVCANVYPYAPATISSAMGYKSYIAWLKKKIAKNKPLIITEFGLSVAPSRPEKSAPGTTGYGYGGNSLAEQAEGMEMMMRSIAQAGASGMCPFMWTDGWWKSPEGKLPGHEFTHDQHPEEWFGIIEVNEPKVNLFGEPRPAYYSIQKYFSSLVLDPAAYTFSKNFPWLAVASDSIDSVTVSLDGQDAASMKRSGTFFIPDAWLPALPGSVPAQLKNKNLTYDFIRADQVHVNRVIADNDPVRALTVSAPAEVSAGKDITAVIKGSPRQRVNFTVYDYYSGQSIDYRLRLDKAGKFTYTFPTRLRRGYYGFAAGFGQEENVISGDLAIVRVDNAEQSGPSNPAELKKVIYENFDAGGNIFSEQYTGSAKLDITMDSVRAGVKPAPTMVYKPSSSSAWAYTATNAKSHNRKNAKYWGLRINGDNSNNIIKIYLRDQDGERWLYSAVKIDFSGWKEIIFPCESLFRDPYDGVKNGNHKPDDTINGFAFVFTGGTETKIAIDELAFYY